MRKFHWLCAALSLGVTLSAAADDAALYWMIGTDEEIGSEFSGYTDVQIAVRTAAGETVLTPVSATGAYTKDDIVDAQDWGDTMMTFFDSQYATSEYLFYIELYNDGTLIGTSTQGIAGNSSYVKTSEMETPMTWSVSDFTPVGVPEPTSGLLVLVGAGLLALRRRESRSVNHA